MRFSFDLISDLHIDTWPMEFDWGGQPTSQFCVVAGDVARDKTLLLETLSHLGRCYQGVFYIDGNEEHKNDYNNVGKNYQEISSLIEGLENVVYLQDNVVIIEGVAILGTNGWWSWDFDPSISYDDCQHWFSEKTHCLPGVPDDLALIAAHDAKYLGNSIRRLQKHIDVKKIILVTHTVPRPDLINHDLDLVGTYRMNCMGNSFIQYALSDDHGHKVSHWCFGHYHGNVDRTINGVRYVNNCRGRGDTAYNRSVYYPLRIDVDY